MSAGPEVAGESWLHGLRRNEVRHFLSRLILSHLECRVLVLLQAISFPCLCFEINFCSPIGPQNSHSTDTLGATDSHSGPVLSESFQALI